MCMPVCCCCLSPWWCKLRHGYANNSMNIINFWHNFTKVNLIQSTKKLMQTVTLIHCCQNLTDIFLLPANGTSLQSNAASHWLDSCAVMACKNFCSDIKLHSGVTLKRIFHRIWIMMENRSWNEPRTRQLNQHGCRVDDQSVRWIFVHAVSNVTAMRG